MRVLVIGRDPKLLDERSEAFQRIREYAGLFDRYYVLNVGVRGEIIHEGNLTIEFIPSRFFGVMKRAQKIIHEEKIGVIDAQDAGETGFTAWRVSRATGVLHRLQIHTDVFSPWYRRAGWKERIRYLLAKFLIPRADCIRVVSERIKRSLESRIKNQELRITVLPIFTDISKFLTVESNVTQQERFHDYDFKIVAVGRFFDKEKNFSMLIDMMRDFVKICPKAILVLVGDGPDRENLKSKVKSLKLENNIVIEAVPYSELPSYLKLFDLFLLSSNYEGWGRVVIEAMASRLPVVMTDVGLAGEVVHSGENGVVVPVGDKKAFLDAVAKIYENPEKRERLAEAALKTVKAMTPRVKKEYLLRYRAAFQSCKFVP